MSSRRRFTNTRHGGKPRDAANPQEKGPKGYWTNRKPEPGRKLTPEEIGEWEASQRKAKGDDS